MASVTAVALAAVLVALAFAPGASSLRASGSASPKVYVFGDIHYDPFYGTANAVGPCTGPLSAPQYSAAGCDTSLVLLESAMKDVATQYAQDGEGLLLITGDIVRHNMKDFETDTANPHAKEYDLVGVITNVVDSVIQKYMAATGLSRERARNLVVPHPSIVPTLGNDDSVPDYHFNDSISVHPALAKYATSLVNNSVLSAAEAAQFSKCGFYSRVVPSTALRIVAMNSLMYSVEHSPNSQDAITDPCGQFAWLQQQLSAARANSQSVYILGHIIPFAQKWEQHYIDAYREIVKDFADVIRVQFFGHTHMFSFLALSRSKAPLLFDVPAISPIDGQRPSYLRVSTATYDSKPWSVDEIHLRYLDSSTNEWKDGDQFCNTFQLTKPLTTEQLFTFGSNLASLSDSSSAWNDFQRMHFGGEVGSKAMSAKKKKKLCCDMISWNDTDYRTCKEEY